MKQTIKNIMESASYTIIVVTLMVLGLIVSVLPYSWIACAGLVTFCVCFLLSLLPLVVD